MAKKSKKQRAVYRSGGIMRTGMRNLIGVSMIGATASMTNSLPAGTAKTIAGTIPAIQSVALVESNLGKCCSGNRDGPRKDSEKQRLFRKNRRMKNRSYL